MNPSRSPRFHAATCASQTAFTPAETSWSAAGRSAAGLPHPKAMVSASAISGTARMSFHRSVDFVANDLAAFHHEPHALQFGDVRQRIAGDGDQVGVLALVNRSKAIQPSHDFGVDHGAA